VHLIVSATPPPESTPRRLVAPNRTDEELWAAVQALYGLPVQRPEPALLELAIPPLRHDLAILASYVYRPEEPLATPLTALYASADPMVERAAAERWCAQTRNRFAVHEVPGKHLYLQDSPAALLARVRAALEL
jgi:surfactin synthase thioesterase subunit